MCGLVGIAGYLQFKDEFTMKRLLLADYFRGPDSTGLAAIRTDGTGVISKLDSNPINLFDMTKFKSVLNGNASRAFIGHNRLATKGGISTANAHPFQIDHIIGAHNGTLCFRGIKALEEALGEQYAVDSELLFAAIAKLGVKKAIELCYEGKDSSTGAWALVWYNKEEDSLNFLRNKHRDLYMAWELDFKKLFWASEWWMIREALESSAGGYTIYTQPAAEKGKRIGYFSFEADIHYKFNLSDLADNTENKTKPKPKTKKIAGRQWNEGCRREENFTLVNETGVRFPNQIGHGTRGTECTKTNSQSSSSMIKSRGNSNKKRDVIHLIGDAHHPYANIIDEARFSEVAFQGCGWCKRPVVFGEPGVIIYERDSKTLCRKCAGVPDEVDTPPSRIFIRPALFRSMC